MKMPNIRFDDPEDLRERSWTFISTMHILAILDYARRYFERKGDRSSIRRAQEIRKFYKQVKLDYSYIVRSIIPEEVIKDYEKLTFMDSSNSNDE